MKAYQLFPVIFLTAVLFAQSLTNSQGSTKRSSQTPNIQATVTNVYNPIITDYQSPPTENKQGCTEPSKNLPMYEPTLYQYPDGSLGMITQGSLGLSTGDSLFRWKRSPAGSWSTNDGGFTPSDALTWFKEPARKEMSMPYGWGQNPCNTTKQLTSYTGSFGGPETIVLNNKVYMAFQKGNGDTWSGEVWWAVSSDWGVTWSVYPSPILYGLYHRGHDANGNCNEGFTGISMATSNSAGVTWINIYGAYSHPGREKPNGHGMISAIHYRFRYDPNHPYGFSPTKELYYNGSFINHSGKFVWDFDMGAPYGSDIKLDSTLTQAPWYKPDQYFTGSVTRDFNGIYYMLVDHWRVPGETGRLYYVTSCDAVNWSSVKAIDTTAISNLYPGKSVINNAIWYGTLTAGTGPPQTGMWGFFSLDPFCNNEAYNGTRILPVKIAFNMTQTCN